MMKKFTKRFSNENSNLLPRDSRRSIQPDRGEIKRNDPNIPNDSILFSYKE
jgi:hypothetical protein